LAKFVCLCVDLIDSYIFYERRANIQIIREGREVNEVQRREYVLRKPLSHCIVYCVLMSLWCVRFVCRSEARVRERSLVDRDNLTARSIFKPPKRVRFSFDEFEPHNDIGEGGNRVQGVNSDYNKGIDGN